LKNCLNSHHDEDVLGAIEVILAGNIAGFPSY